MKKTDILSWVAIVISIIALAVVIMGRGKPRPHMVGMDKGQRGEMMQNRQPDAKGPRGEMMQNRQPDAKGQAMGKKQAVK